MVAEFIQQKLN